MKCSYEKCTFQVTLQDKNNRLEALIIEAHELGHSTENYRAMKDFHTAYLKGVSQGRLLERDGVKREFDNAQLRRELYLIEK